MAQTVHVLWWRYSDGSGAGVVRAYEHERRALEDQDLLAKTISSCDYEITTVPLFADLGYDAGKGEGE